MLFLAIVSWICGPALQKTWITLHVRREAEPPSGACLDKSSFGQGESTKSLASSAKVVRPDLSRMVIYDPRQRPGPSPDVDMIMSVLLHCDISSGAMGVSMPLSQPSYSFPSHGVTGDVSSLNKGRPILNGSTLRSSWAGQPGKRKELERQDEDENVPVQNRPLQRDIFRMRQIQRNRGLNSTQTGSTSGGSGALAGEPSGSTE